MSVHFEFLKAEWSKVYEAAAKAESLAYPDPRAACFYSRRAPEIAVTWLFNCDNSLTQPYKIDLSAFLFEPSFKALVGTALHTKLDIIRKNGNYAVHSSKTIRVEDAIATLRELFHFCYWLGRNYGLRASDKPAPSATFDPNQLPKTSPIPPQTIAQLQTLADQLAAKDKQLADSQSRLSEVEGQLSEVEGQLSEVEGQLSEVETELQKLKQAIAQAKAENAAQPDTHDYTEAQTRDYFIDLLLKEAGWALDSTLLTERSRGEREFPVQGMPNEKGEGFVDYVLWGDDGKPLAVVEAKRTRRDPQVGQQQAKLYADCLEQQFGQRPIIFYTNGYQHWIWDDASYPPRPVQGFFKKAELELMIQRRTIRRSLLTAEIDQAIVERHYQTRAIRRISEAFERQNERKALVVMATGAGKTRTVIALCDLLKLVRSKTKFWQMIGRGTRLCPNLFAPNKHKEFFYLFDFCQNLEYFSQNPETTEGAIGNSLSKRLFTTRLELIGELDKRPAKGGSDERSLQPGTVAEPAGTYGKTIDPAKDPTTEAEVRQAIATSLQTEVAAMNLDNFIVRPKRQWVEMYAQPEVWNQLQAEQISELTNNVAGLPNELPADGEDAKRFDLIMLKLQLGRLRPDPQYTRLSYQVREIAAALEERDGVPIVQEQMELIQEIQTDAWWEDVTVPMLERARKRLRFLVRLIERTRREPLYTDFEDELGTKTEIELSSFGSGTEFDRFRAKARQFLLAHEGHITIHKLRFNQPLTPTDLSELERILLESGVGTPEHLEYAKETSRGLGLFIRSLVGLNREAAKQAFGQFLSGSTTFRGNSPLRS